MSYILCAYWIGLAQGEDVSFDEAFASQKWKAAMNEEMRAIEKNDRWELTSRSS